MSELVGGREAAVSSFDYWCFLVGESAAWLALLGFITTPVFCAATALVVWACNRVPVSAGRVLVASVAPAILPVCALVVGVAFVRPECTGWAAGVHPPVPWFASAPSGVPMGLFTVLLLLHVPVGVGLGWWARRGWPAAVASTLWWGWVSVVAGIPAQMSVTGAWL